MLPKFTDGVKIARAALHVTLEAWSDRPRKARIRVDRSATLPMPRRGLHRIELRWRDGASKDEYPATLELDCDKRTIGWNRTSGFLLGKEHKGSGFIGLMVFTAPVAALLTPYLALSSGEYARRERSAGMSRHGIALLKSIRKQLTPEERSLLTDALRKDWAADQRLREHPTFEQAQRLLQTLELSESRWRADDPEIFGAGPVVGYTWLDADGHRLAHGSLEDGTLTVHVLGSTFEADQAKALCAFFATRRLWRDGKEQAAEGEE